MKQIRQLFLEGDSPILNVNTDTLIKNMKLAELNISIATDLLNRRISKMI